jgi:methyltransferase (TIGR00027 family)
MVTLFLFQGAIMAISVTSVFCAFLRGFHSAHEKPVIFDDPFALRLIPGDRMGMILGGFSSMQATDGTGCLDAFISRTIQSMPTTAQVLSRAAYAEARLRELAARGIAQYVVLGAGLDSFCLRKPADSPVRAFEIDAAETQEFKKAQIARVMGSLPERTSFVAADVSTDDVSAALASSGFSPTEPCFVSMLGLAMYLDEAAIKTLLGKLFRSCAVGSEIAFDGFDGDAFDPERCSPSFRAMLAQAEVTGERYRSCCSADAIRDIARSCGFSVAEYLGPTEIDARFFSGRDDAYRACEHVAFVRLRRDREPGAAH